MVTTSPPPITCSGIPEVWAKELIAQWQGSYAVDPGSEFLVLGAVETPRIASLDAALDGLIAATTSNDLNAIRELSAVLPRMMERAAGRIVVVTFEPKSLKFPEDAAVRATSQGLLAYSESLRPALRLRGIVLGVLLLRVGSLERWSPEAKRLAVTQEIVALVASGRKQRIVALD